MPFFLVIVIVIVNYPTLQVSNSKAIRIVRKMDIIVAVSLVGTAIIL